MDPNPTKVSILIPFFRVEQYIERCAKSVFEQSYPHIEYIFVDDCSPDNSCAILERLIENYPHRKTQITIIHNPHNWGVASSRNVAIKHSTGDFISWVDADDYLDPEAITNLVRRQKETEADIVSGQYVEHRKNEDFIVSLAQSSSKQETLKGILDYNVPPMLWGRLIRLSLYKTHRIKALEGVNYREDAQVITRLLYYAQSISTLDQVVYHYDRTNE